MKKRGQSRLKQLQIIAYYVQFGICYRKCCNTAKMKFARALACTTDEKGFSLEKNNTACIGNKSD